MELESFTDDGHGTTIEVYKAVKEEMADTLAKSDYKTVFRSEEGYTNYLSDPTISLSKEKHHPYSYPEGIEISSIPDDVEIKNVLLSLITESEEQITNNNVNVIDITDKKFTLNQDEKTVVLGGAALLGILISLGLATKLKTNKNGLRHRYDDYYDMEGITDNKSTTRNI